MSMTPFEEEVKRTVEALQAGKTILYPTDTIWGIGCDATNSKACDKVYEAKKRPANKSLSRLRRQDFLLKSIHMTLRQR